MLESQLNTLKNNKTELETKVQELESTAESQAQYDFKAQLLKVKEDYETQTQLQVTKSSEELQT